MLVLRKDYFIFSICSMASKVCENEDIFTFSFYYLFYCYCVKQDHTLKTNTDKKNKYFLALSPERVGLDWTFLRIIA
jgi:hypothetical protein